MTRARAPFAVLALAMNIGIACSSCARTARAPASESCAHPGVINSVVAVSALSACTTVTGDVRIRGGAIETLTGLDQVEHITGDLHIGPTLRLAAIYRLTRLAVVDGDVIIDANMQASVAVFPALKRIGGRLTIRGNIALTGVDVPALTRIEGPVTIARNPELSRFVGRALERIGNGLDIRQNPSLDTISLPQLKPIDGSSDGPIRIDN